MIQHKRMTAAFLTVLAAWALLLPSATMAGTVAFSFQHFSEGGANGDGSYDYIAIGNGNDHYDAGFEFTASQDLKITHLGTFDYDNGAVAASMSGTFPGLDVAIYQTNGTFVASSTVVSSDTAFPAGIDARAGGTLNSSFRYHLLATPVELPAGNYVIISETQTGGFFSWVVAGGPYPQLLNDYSSILPGAGLGVSYVGSRIRNSPAGISSAAFFSDAPTGYPGYFGPNFIAVVPEPTTLVLVAVGGAMLVWRRARAR